MADQPRTCTIVYNGSCPVCGPATRAMARAAAGQDHLHWVDIDDAPGLLMARGHDDWSVRKRFTVMDGQGHIHQGVDAAATLWAATRGRGWMARILRLPVVYQLAWLIYEGLMVPPLYWYNRRKARHAPARSDR